jgi:PH domain
MSDGIGSVSARNEAFVTDGTDLSNLNSTLEVDTSIEDDNENEHMATSTPPRYNTIDRSDMRDYHPQDYYGLVDDIVDYVQSDDDVVHQPFLNEDGDDEVDSDVDIDVSRTESLEAEIIRGMADHPFYYQFESMGIQEQEDEEQQHHHHHSSSFSVNVSSTTGSTVGGTTIGRSNTHQSRDYLHQFDDTTTSYNTDEGYADDESDRNIRAILGAGAQQQQQQQHLYQQQQHSVSDEGTMPSSALNQHNVQSPPSPSNRLTTQSRSASVSPGMNNSISQPSSTSFFRYLRSWGKSSNESATVGIEPTDIGSGGGTGGDRADLTSDDDDDDFSMSQEETSWVDDDDDTSDSSNEERTRDDRLRKFNIDWNRLPMLPNRFCLPPLTSTFADGTSSINVNSGSATTAPPHYLDASLFRNAQKHLTSAEATEFVLDHNTLLQAVLQLLAERDQVGVEGSMDSTENIWKKGSLKKLSFSVGRRMNQRPAVAGAWKVKYVELRRGNLCYYEDSGKTGCKTIHLRQADTIVQESDSRGPRFVFELLVQGSPTRYWMASSEEERQAWIKAIQLATIGDDAPRKDLDLQPYEESLEVYESVRESIQLADSQELYLEAIQRAMKELASLQVPVQWVQEQIENELSPILLGTLKPPKFGRSPQKLLKSSIAEFWKNMNQTTFSINGLTVSRNTQLSSERIVGALTRCILEYDKEYVASYGRDVDGAESTYISELQAISYARHILLTVLRSKERQDTSFVVRYLLENPNVMISEQNPSDDTDINPVNIEVSFAGEDLPDEFLHSEEMASWVWTRTRRKNPSSIAATVSSGGRKQRNTFAVLSGTVLSYYAAASPRPHGLRGQLVLSSTTSVRYEGEEIMPDNDSSLSGVRHVLCIVSESHQDRLLSFENYNDLMTWKDAIQLAIDTACPGV